MAMLAPGRVLSPGEVVQEMEVVKDEEWHEDLNVHLICPDCREDPPNLVDDSSAGDTICGSCGLVISGRVIDSRSEWRTFSNDDQGNDDPSRVGDAANPLLNGSQLQTSIAFGDGNVRSRDLGRAQNKITADKTTKTLLAAYKQIGAFCDSSHLQSSVADTAKQYFKIADEGKVLKGKSQDVVIASCIFIACRRNEVPRTFKEIMSLTKVPKKEIGRTFKLLEKFLRIHLQENKTSVQGGMVVENAAYSNTSATKAQELCRRYCNYLGMGNPATIVAQELAERLVSKGLLDGRSPISVAGVAIYMASHAMGEPKSPKEISGAANVSDGTIRSAYKYVYPNRESIVDLEWLTQKGGDITKLPSA